MKGWFVQGILIFLFYNNLISQNSFENSFYEFPEKIPTQYLFNPEIEYQRLQKEKLPGFDKKDQLKFSETVSYYKRDLFLGGHVYLNWEELESYLNEVFQKILPVEVQKNAPKIYAYRSAAFNAYTIHDGSMFVNIGLISDVTNEAALALILGHEYAHFIHNDVRNSYLDNLKTHSKKNINSDPALQLESLHKSRKKEISADSLGFDLCASAGYDIQYASDNFILFEELEKKEVEEQRRTRIINEEEEGGEENEMEEDTLTDLKSTHPRARQRIIALDKFCKKNLKPSKRKTWIVKEETFKSIQKKARLESLHLLLSNHKYRSCIRRAFIYHLFDPENTQYLYFLLESLRRYIYLFPDKKKNGFLTEEYDLHFENGKGILHDLNYLLWSEKKKSMILAKEFSDTLTIEFENYKEAFDYFSKYVNKLKIKEGLFTLALYQHNKRSIRDSLLTKYIGFKNIQNEVYGRRLLKADFPNSPVPTEEIVLVNDVTIADFYFSGLYFQRIKGDKMNKIYSEDLKKMTHRKFPHKKMIFLSDLMKNNLRKYKYYEQLFYAYQLISSQEKKRESSEASSVIYFSNSDDSSQTEEPLNLFILDPRLWNFMNDNHIKSIELLNTSSYTNHTRRKDYLRNNELVNLFYYLFYPLEFYHRFFCGATKYGFEINYVFFEPIQNDLNCNYITRKYPYHINRGLFLNAVYYIFKENAKSNR